MSSQQPQQQQPQQSVVMDLVPIEIIERFGRSLDRPSLVSSLQVCKDWYRVLCPLVWETITTRQCRGPRFPLQHRLDSLYIPVDPPLQRNLLRIRHIEWVNNPSQSVKTFGQHRPLQRTLESILQYSHYLKSFRIKLSEVYQGPIMFLHLLRKIRSLRRLDIELGGWYDFNLVLIFPVLSQLEDLRLAGGLWYTWDPRTVQETAWKIQRLSIDFAGISLIRYCPDLRELDISITKRFIDNHLISIRQVSDCHQLESLRIRRVASDISVQDLVEVLTSLRGLKRVSYFATSIEEVEFLCWSNMHSVAYIGSSEQNISASGSGSRAEINNGRAVADDLTLPLLEHYELTIAHNWAFDNFATYPHYPFYNILATRPALRTFIVNGFAFMFDIQSMFSAEMTPPQEWACRGLEILSLDFARIRSPPSAKELSWQPFYRQIGLLTRLRSLWVRCPDMKIGPGSGIEAIAGANNLERLALLGGRVTWTENEVVGLLCLLPKLSILRLSRNGKSIVKRVGERLQEFGRQVDFNTSEDTFATDF